MLTFQASAPLPKDAQVQAYTLWWEQHNQANSMLDKPLFPLQTHDLARL
ncbi:MULTISPECIES: hypothetical protein [unclassified Rhizobium]